MKQKLLHGIIKDLMKKPMSAPGGGSMKPQAAHVEITVGHKMPDVAALSGMEEDPAHEAAESPEMEAAEPMDMDDPAEMKHKKSMAALHAMKKGY